ncbi:MAG: hypothetical protein PVJ78_11140 [Gammaproteobacteria bacterium]
MKALPAAFGLWLAAGMATAAESWNFEPRIAVTGEPEAGMYQHLDGAGRKHIAISGSSIAAVWEDNRDGSPQVYAVLKPVASKRFEAAIKVSEGGEAWEPSIASYSGDRFVLAWEQDGAVLAALIDANGIGRPLQLAPRASSHAGVAVYEDRIFVSWRERRGGAWFIRVAVLGSAGDGALAVESTVPVERGGVPTPVQYPALAVNEAGISIAWEDRRAGHTRILASHSSLDPLGFGEPFELNEYYSARNIYDKGSGATRVVMASYAADEILAAWMDKRRSGGYGIFASLGSGDIFGPNEKVQGKEGDLLPHYNPAVAGNPAGEFIVAWDDYRRGDADIWLSAYGEGLNWGADFSPPPASGPGEQTSPSIALDADGGLHLLWIERGSPDSPSRLWYSLGKPR